MSAIQALNLGYLGATARTQKPLLLPGTKIQSLPLLAPPSQFPRLRREPSSIKTSVAAIDSSSPTDTQESQTKRYHFVVANAKFMLDEEEHFQEQLCERLRLFEERKTEQDFWLVIEPKFLEKFPNVTKRLKRPAVALISTNGPWITFMKLRLDRVLQDSFEADSIEEALASDPVTIEFEKPKNWIAPYPKYESGWWEAFLPPVNKPAAV